jgi:hypothetical protein
MEANMHQSSLEEKMRRLAFVNAWLVLLRGILQFSYY